MLSTGGSQVNSAVDGDSRATAKFCGGSGSTEKQAIANMVPMHKTLAKHTLTLSDGRYS